MIFRSILRNTNQFQNKYVVYDATGYDDPLVLTDAIHTVVDNLDILFEIIQTDMDLFDTTNASEKLAQITGDKLAMYNYIMNDHNFFYIREAAERDNLGTSIGEGAYNFSQAIFNFDLNYSSDQTKQITRKLVGQLLTDESMQQSIDATVETTYLEVVTAVLKTTGDLLSGTGETSQSDLEVFKKVFSDSSNMRKLGNALESGGFDAMWARALDIAGTAGVSALLNSDLIKTHLQNNGVISKAFGGACSNMSTFLEGVTGIFDAWNVSTEMTNQLVAISAAQKESEELLDMLIAYTKQTSSIHSELVNIKESLKDVEHELWSQFYKRAFEAGVEMTASELTGHLISTYGGKFSIVYSLSKLTFGTLDYVFDWKGSIEDLHVLRVNAVFSDALEAATSRYSMHTTDNQEALYKIKALKYLIKMRIAGEHNVVDILSGDSTSEQERALKSINDVMLANYTSLTSYFRDVRTRLLTYRDTLFATYHTTLDIPDAPKVSINFLTSATNESFSSNHEYSFEGSTWYVCANSPIAVDPAAVTRWLWVRIRSTDTNPAGNVTKIAIPARPFLRGDIVAEYHKEGYYTISGVASGSYRYAFADSTEGTPSYTNIDISGSVSIMGVGRHTYFLLQSLATESSFASTVRTVVVKMPEEGWVLDRDTGIIAGLQEATMGRQVYDYYTYLGKSVTITDTQGNTVNVNDSQYIGTGYIITVDDEDYTVIIPGDVDGNGEIELFDLYPIIEYLNSDASLEGPYLQAAQVSQGDELSLFDLIQLADILNAE